MSWSIYQTGTADAVINNLLNLAEPVDQPPVALAAFRAARETGIAHAQAMRDSGLPDGAHSITIDASGHSDKSGLGVASFSAYFNYPVPDVFMGVGGVGAGSLMNEATGETTEIPADAPSPSGAPVITGEAHSVQDPASPSGDSEAERALAGGV